MITISIFICINLYIALNSSFLISYRLDKFYEHESYYAFFCYWGDIFFVFWKDLLINSEIFQKKKKSKKSKKNKKRKSKKDVNKKKKTPPKV